MSGEQVDFDAQLVAFAEDLRSEGVAVGTSEMLDAFLALELVAWSSPGEFRETLATTIAKSPEDRRLFDLVFDRFFFRATELQAVRLDVSEPQTRVGGDEVDLDELRRQIARALEEGGESDLRDLARLAIAAFGKGQGSGVLGVDVQRIRRALGLRTEPQPDLPPEDPRRDGISRDQLRRFEQALRRELERAQIERNQALPPKRALTDLDRSLPGRPGPGPGRRASGRGAAAPAARLAGSRAARPQPPRPRRRARDDARLAADRRRAGAAEVPPQAPAAARAVRAL